MILCHVLRYPSLHLLLNDRCEVQRDSLPLAIDVADNERAVRGNGDAELVDVLFGGQMCLQFLRY